MADFSGRTVLITGATGGFGQAAARRFSEAGAKLILSDLEEAPLKALAKSLTGEAHILTADVSVAVRHVRLAAFALEKTGRLDIAVNNAGIAHDMMPLAKTPIDTAQKVIEVDLLGVFYAMRAQLPVMEQSAAKYKTQGSIINVASVAGVVGAPMLAVYAAAKHGVVGLTKAAALEYARRNIRINALCPSFARTAMVTGFLEGSGREKEEAEASLTRAIPMGRLAEVDEVMTALLYLADPAASFVTGQTIQVDGGLSAL